MLWSENILKSEIAKRKQRKAKIIQTLKVRQLYKFQTICSVDYQVVQNVNPSILYGLLSTGQLAALVSIFLFSSIIK